MDKKRFKIALSFPGEYRSLVEDVVENLTDFFSPSEILYDLFHQSEFSRENLDLYMQDLYKKRSELVVIFYGPAYNEKTWCCLEYRAIRALLNESDNKNPVMFIKCADGDIPGFFESIDGSIEACRFEPSEIAHFIIKRYFLNHSVDISKKCRYNVLALDDNEEQLEMLKHELKVAFSSCPYYPRIICVNTPDDALNERETCNTLDACILDVAQRGDLHQQAPLLVSFGADFYRQLIGNDLNEKVKPQVYVYSRLDCDKLRGVFGEDGGIIYLQKTKVSIAEVAKKIRTYLDMQYKIMLHGLIQSERE